MHMLCSCGCSRVCEVRLGRLRMRSPPLLLLPLQRSITPRTSIRPRFVLYCGSHSYLCATPTIPWRTGQSAPCSYYGQAELHQGQDQRWQLRPQRRGAVAIYDDKPYLHSLHRSCTHITPRLLAAQAQNGSQVRHRSRGRADGVDRGGVFLRTKAVASGCYCSLLVHAA